METLSRWVLTFLLNALWQTALITFVVAAAARLLRRAPARYCHALWAAGLVLSVLLPLASLREPIKSGTPPPVIERGKQSEPELPPSRANLAQNLGAGSPDSISDPPSITGKLLNSFARRKRSIAFPPWVGEAALGFYLVLLLIQLARLVRAWKRARQIRTSAQSRALRPESRALLAQCLAAMGLRHVTVRTSSELAGPATMGVIHPEIILPEALFDGPASDEFASALCHEMAHIRRNDYLLNLICEVALVALAFHPAAWLMKRRIDETRELACDEAASQRFLGPAAYARSLVSLANSIAPLGLNSRPGCTLGVFDSNILEKRVMKLLNNQPQISSRRARMLFAAAALALALGALTAGAFSVEASAPMKSPNPVTLARESANDSTQNETRPGGPAGGVTGGPSAGVTGGIAGGIPVGVSGGVSEGVDDSITVKKDENAGSVSGTVFDPSGARVPHAMVFIMNVADAPKKSGETNESGVFSLTNLPIGVWNLAVTKLGFKTVQVNVVVFEKKTTSVIIDLEPGIVNQEIVVKGARVKGATPAPATVAHESLRVGGSIEAAKLIAATHPEYPESVRAKGIQGEVLLEAVISKEGVPLSLKVITSPDDALSKAALEAVKTWRYKPTLLNDEPIEVATTIAVDFQLRD